MLKIENELFSLSCVKATQLNDKEIIQFPSLLFDEHALLWYKYLPDEIKANKGFLTNAFLEKYGITRTDY